MYALLFRNRWFALVWALLMVLTAVSIATRGLSGVIGNPPEEAATTEASDSFARWAADEPKPAEEQAGADDAGTDQGGADQDGRGKRVEVRIYHDAPQDGGGAEDLADNPGNPGPEGEGQPDGAQ